MLGRLTLVLAFAGASAAQAQIGRFPPQGGYGQQPGYWVGLSYGYLEGLTINDGESGSVWQFGYTSQIRATLEKTLQGGFAAGIGAGFASPSLLYSGGTFTSGCPGSCNATADVTQWMLFLRSGGGAGFHGVYSLEGGFTEFSNFRDPNGNTLAPTNAKYDGTFGFGGGFGYGFSRTSDVYIAEQYSLILHSQSGAGVSQQAPRQLTFRAGFRVGF